MAAWPIVIEIDIFIHFIDPISEYGDQRVYLYDYQGRPFYSNKPDFISADHGDDVYSVFGISRFSDVYGFEIPADKLEEATRLEDTVMQYFISFAKTGLVHEFSLP